MRIADQLKGQYSSSRIRTFYLVAFLVVTQSLAGCSKLFDDKSLEPGKEVSIDRHVVFSDVTVDTLIPLSDGGFLVGGGDPKGWVVHVDSVGKTTWGFAWPEFDDQNLSIERSHVKGAIQLENKNIILCGSQFTVANGVRSVLLTLGPDGTLIKTRQIDATTKSHINLCIPWHGGFAVVGTDEPFGRPNNWLLRLDAAGEVEWKKSISLNVSDALQSDDGGLLIKDYPTGVFKLDASGNINSSVAVDSPRIELVHRREPVNGVTVVLYDANLQIKRVITYDAQLHQIKSTSADIPIDPSFGGVFSDDKGALTMFGSTQQKLFGIIKMSSYSAAMIQTSPRISKTSEYIPQPFGASAGFEKVISLEQDRYLTVRAASNFENPRMSGLKLLWVNVN